MHQLKQLCSTPPAVACSGGRVRQGRSPAMAGKTRTAVRVTRADHVLFYAHVVSTASWVTSDNTPCCYECSVTECGLSPLPPHTSANLCLHSHSPPPKCTPGSCKRVPTSELHVHEQYTETECLWGVVLSSKQFPFENKTKLL